MRATRRTICVGRLMLGIAMLSLPLSLVMRALNPPSPKAVLVGNPTALFGTQPINTPGQREWVIRNEGNAPLAIEEPQPGCTYYDFAPGSSRIVPPGGQTTIVLHWTGSSRPGPTRAQFSVATNDMENPRILLTAQGQVIP